MTAKVESLPPTAKIAFAVHRMDLGGYRHIPVVNADGEPTGIFSVRDILAYLTRKLAAK
jgi:CBS domain-containing protein